MIASASLSSSPLFLLGGASSHRRAARCVAIRASAPAIEPPSSSLYEVLGVSRDATGQEIKSAYRSLARACHPDVVAAGASAEEFMRVRAAFSTLSDPDKRADYDRSLVVVGRRLRPACARRCGRAWETDQCW